MEMSILILILVIWVLWAIGTIIFWSFDKKKPEGYEKFLRIPVLFIGPLVLLIPLADWLLKEKNRK